MREECRVTPECDRGGRPLNVGDPVTLVGGIANRGRVGYQSHGEVDRFARTNVYVRISDSSSEELIGQVVPVPGGHLSYGYSGYVRAADGMRSAMEDMQLAIERDVRTKTEAALKDLILTARDRSIITPEQTVDLWRLWKETDGQEATSANLGT